VVTRGRAAACAGAIASAIGLATPASAADEAPTTTTTTTTTPSGTTTTTVTSPTQLDPFVPYPPPSPRVIGPPETSYDYSEPKYYPSLAWLAFQLVPSPEVAFGRLKQVGIGEDTASEKIETAFGLRWQLTPVLWSWGVHRRLSRWRWFVVDPLARNAGSIELDTSFEYIWGYVDRMIVRPGVRATFPLVQRGEYLSFSMGTSTYTYDRVPRVAYDGGVYFLYGIFGAQVTIAPAHNPLAAIATFRIRYF
jgi:hypothetical protein